VQFSTKWELVLARKNRKLVDAGSHAVNTYQIGSNSTAPQPELATSIPNLPGGVLIMRIPPQPRDAMHKLGKSAGLTSER